MNHQERLFLAIGEADPELVARSERGRGSRRLGYGLAAAACLLLVLALGRVLPLGSRPVPALPDSQTPPAVAPDGGGLVLPERGGEIGTLRLLSYAPEERDTAVDFLIYVNEEQFAIREEDGLYSIRNTQPLPEGFPECGMDIFRLPGTSPSQARQEAEDALRERYPQLSGEESAAALPDSLYLRASERLEDLEETEFWRAEQAELWFVSDGQGGTFVLSARYFLEAEEGLGARFRDMASSFRVVNLRETVPDWMRELYAAVDRLSRALFSGDLSGVSELLAEGADGEAYGENVWPEISVISVDYTLDDGRNPGKALVSVKHRRNRTEGDSFSYLTMELVRRDGNWVLTWSGIEK